MNSTRWRANKLRASSKWAALAVLALVACAPETIDEPTHSDDDGTATPTPSPANSPTPTPGPCPVDMAHIPDGPGFCIDLWEARIAGHSPFVVPETTDNPVAKALGGEIPQGYISGAVAELSCTNAGKRLCALNEWMRACQGSGTTTWPYGNSYDATACNDSRGEHPINSFWGTDPDRWDTAHMNDPGINQQPDTVDRGGSNLDCVSEDGVFDLHGNLHEWIADPAGTFKGGFYVDASINGEGCGYQTTAHSFDYHDYSTGFRCCTDPN